MNADRNIDVAIANFNCDKFAMRVFLLMIVSQTTN